MAYRMRSQVIQPGGLDFRVPGQDAAPASVEFRGFWPDSAGRLLQSKGYTTVSGGSVAGIGCLGLRLNSDFTGRRYARVAATGSDSLVRIDDATAITGLADRDGKGSLVSDQGYMWCPDTTLPVRDDGTDTFDWSIPKPSSAPSGAEGSAGSVDGTVAYVQTFITADGEEGPPSDASADVTVTDKQVTVTLVAVPSPSSGCTQNITGRRLYRAGGSLTAGQLLLVATLNDTDTTYTDDRSDESLLLDNVECPTLGMRAVPACVGAVNYYGKMLTWNGANVYYSGAFRPWVFEDGFLPVGESYDAIQQISAWQNYAIVYKLRSIWRIVGDPADGVIEKIEHAIGCVGPLAVVTAEDGDYFVGVEGVYRCNGDRVEKISAPLDPVFRGEYPFRLNGVDAKPVNRQALAKIALGSRGSRVYLSYPGGADTENSRGFVYDRLSQRWADTDLVFRLWYDEGTGYDLLATDGTTLFSVEDGYGFGGEDPSLVWQPSYDDQGAADRMKVYADLEFEANTQGQGMNVSSVLNGGKLSGDQIAQATITVSAMAKQRVALAASGGGVLRGYNFAPRFEVDGADDASLPIEIRGPVVLHFYFEPRTARAFDSGPTDLGLRDAKSVGGMRLDIETLDTMTWKVYTDLPGGTMTQRATGTVASGARRPVNIPLSGYEGYQVRVLLSSTAGFLLYGLQLLVLRLGLLIDGASSETLEIGPLGVV